MEFLTCVQPVEADADERPCGLPAEVLDRYVLPSTDGPVEHVKTLCLARHILNGSTAMFDAEAPYTHGAD